jgi:hypothetical protein
MGMIKKTIKMLPKYVMAHQRIQSQLRDMFQEGKKVRQSH